MPSGYKMSKIVKLVVCDGRVFKVLECGHEDLDMTFIMHYKGIIPAAQYVAEQDRLIGRRLRCNKNHE